MKTWEAQIPKTPKIKDRKRCFIVWRNVVRHAIHGPAHLRHGGKGKPCDSCDSAYDLYMAPPTIIKYP